MKKILILPLLLVLLSGFVGCKAFRTVTDRGVVAQGSPYELVVVCPQRPWQEALGDTLRSVLLEPVPYLMNREPHYDLLRVNESDYKGLIAQHRNILRISLLPQYGEAKMTVQYDVTAAPQIQLTLQAPDEAAAIDYLSTYRAELLTMLESAERDRAIRYNAQFNQPTLTKIVREEIGIDFPVPTGYTLAQQSDDFLWFRYEYPTSSQGFVLYTRPYEGPQSVTPEALVAARNAFIGRIPGPSEGSYMTTAEAITPLTRAFRLDGRAWIEMRGFWDVAGDFMGGPFVSYTTVDAATQRVVTLDCYIYSPKLPKRNLLRGVEHLLYQVTIPAADQPAEQPTPAE